MFLIGLNVGLSRGSERSVRSVRSARSAVRSVYTNNMENTSGSAKDFSSVSATDV